MMHVSFDFDILSSLVIKCAVNAVIRGEEPTIIAPIADETKVRPMKKREYRPTV